METCTCKDRIPNKTNKEGKSKYFYTIHIHIICHFFYSYGYKTQAHRKQICNGPAVLHYNVLGHAPHPLSPPTAPSLENGSALKIPFEAIVTEF